MSDKDLEKHLEKEDEITLSQALRRLEDGDEDDKKFVKEVRERMYIRLLEIQMEETKEQDSKKNKTTITFKDGSKIVKEEGPKEIKLSDDMKATMEGRKTFNYNKHYDPVSCPECSGAHITTIWERESLNVNGEQKLIVSVPVRKCEGCGFKWIDSVGQDLMDNLIVAYSKDSDYVRWEEVKKELKMKWLKD